MPLPLVPLSPALHACQVSSERARRSACSVGRLSKSKIADLHARVARAEAELEGVEARYDALVAFNAESRRRLEALGRIFDDEDDEEDGGPSVDSDEAPRPPRGPSPPPPPPPAAVLV